jgi:AraC-like DNA-binding protein
MHILFNLKDTAAHLLQPGLPENYQGLILQDSKSFYAQTSSGLIVLQTFERGDFAIQYGIYKFLEVVQCILQPPIFAIGSLLAVKNDLKSSMLGTGAFRLKEGQFSFIQYNGGHIQANFKAGKEYQLLDVSYSPEMLSQTLSNFPDLIDLFQKQISLNSVHSITSQISAENQTLKTVNDLLHSPYDPVLNENHFENKVWEYIWLLLVSTSKMQEPKILLTREQTEKLMQIKGRLEEDSLRKFPIAHLAREMEMNKMKFKQAFRQVVGKPVFEFHIQQRMKEADRLLKETDLPTKAIAKLVGYRLVTSFITKFREYFGYAPGQIVRKR